MFVHLFRTPTLCLWLLQLLLDLVDHILQVDLARGGENPERKHCILPQIGSCDQVQVLAFNLGNAKIKMGDFQYQNEILIKMLRM